MRLIKDYIDQEHGGNISHFAKITNRHRQQIQQWIKAGNVYTDGVDYWIKKQPIISNEDK